MRSILPERAPRGLVFAAVLICALIAAAPAAMAQAPTAEQIEIFQSLSPEQQRAILETLERDGAVTRDEALRRSGRAPEARSAAERRREREARLEMQRESEPRFKAYDSLLISLKIREYKGEGELDFPTAAPMAPAAAPAVPATPLATQPSQAREPIVRTEAETERLADLRTRILRRNPFELDKWGILSAPELGSIPLAGLNVQQARERLAAEPALADFVVTVTYLPVEPVGSRALKPFGQDLFEIAPDTFAPATDIPVPSEYVVGPGDTFEVQLIGGVKGRYSLVVRRDGRINFPELGPINVGGMRFQDARTLIEQRVTEQLIGTQVSVQMGELRSIQVFIVGDAKYPGSYTVSGLSTITNALFVSGGVNDIGSLRNIELKRGGRTISRLDLYDLLLRGDTSADVRLASGDVIFVPPVGPVVGVRGEVRRPALYELKGANEAMTVVELAGGLTAAADARLATVERINEARSRTVIAVDLQAAGARMTLQDGDILHVPHIRPTLENSVIVHGHVHRPGEFQHRSGLRITDVLPSLEELKPKADQHYVLIRREIPPTRRIEFVSVDLAAALEQPGAAEDVLLEPRDQIFVFDLEAGRDRLLQPLMRELRLQSTRAQPTAEVSIGGRVNAPGQYPLEPGMRISDLVRAGASLSEAAYGGKAELTRNDTDGGEARRTELVEIDLARALAGDPEHDIELQPFDYLVIKELPLWGAQEYVEVQGEVRFPGRYPIQRGETLRSVVERAGGLTNLAFARGSVFTRESLRAREEMQLEDLMRRLQTDLAQVSLMAAQEARGDAAQALAVGQQLLENLRNTEAVGRLVINLDRSVAARPGSPQDIVLKDGDRLLVPRITQEVTVIGEVQSPTSHLYAAGLSRDDYVQLSGGTTQRADKSRIYIVRADGSVVSGGARWFRLGGMDIQPGDTIVVPLDAERMRALPLWTAVTTIIYNLAVAVAAVNSF
ncbi:MAG TPA: SLBB domain-containing protein [Steroidobacter sp.]|nr:SLBB domain-containing protein [Steroidobacter sp.]